MEKKSLKITDFKFFMRKMSESQSAL